jgi:hypothetical protein
MFEKASIFCVGSEGREQRGGYSIVYISSLPNIKVRIVSAPNFHLSIVTEMKSEKTGAKERKPSKTAAGKEKTDGFRANRCAPSVPRAPHVKKQRSNPAWGRVGGGLAQPRGGQP